MKKILTVLFIYSFATAVNALDTTDYRILEAENGTCRKVISLDKAGGGIVSMKAEQEKILFGITFLCVTKEAVTFNIDSAYGVCVYYDSGEKRLMKSGKTKEVNKVTYICD